MYGFQPAYYRPYNSDTESDEDEDSASSDYDSDGSIISVGPKALVMAAGMSLITDKQKLEFGVDQISKHVDYSMFEPAPITSNIEYGQTTFETSTQNLNSIVILNSRDRDHSVYPQPTNLVLRLPRVYKNITNLQFSDIKLLSAFYYFRPDKGNVTLYVVEQNRINLDVQSGAPPAAFPIVIDSGSYAITDLVTELNQKMNLYPIFYDFPGGFIEFAQKFVVTGDLATGFNQVGDYFYDIANNTYVTSPALTLTYVTQTFFESRFTNETAFSLTEITNAYYYPPLKLFLLENPNDTTLNYTLTNSTLLPSETVLSRLLYTYQGINDSVAYEVINNNKVFLDKFRSLNTFVYSLVNKYVVQYDSTTNLVTFTSPNLNTSLVNLLTLQYNNYFSSALFNRGQTQASYTSNTTQISYLNATLLGMYNFIQTNLALIYAVNYNTYSLSYLANPTNEILIRDGTNAENIDTTLTLNSIGIEPTNSFSLEIDPPAGYWPPIQTQYSFLNSNTLFNRGYNITGNTFFTTQAISSSNLQPITQLRTHTTDVIVPVTAEQYTIIAFQSPIGQTVQVETLSRPLRYRYPAYNNLYTNTYPSSNIAPIFNYNYMFIDNSNSDTPLPAGSIEQYKTWDSYLIPILGTQFGQDYNIGYTNSYSNQQICSQNSTIFNAIFYVFTSPLVLNPPANTVNKYNITVSMFRNITNNPASIYIYQDRAAFMADNIATGYVPNSNHYKFSATYLPNYFSTDITWNAYENTTYYIVITPTQLPYSQFVVRPLIYFENSNIYTSFSNTLQGFDPTIDPRTDSTGNFFNNFNYAQIYDPDYIRLPISSNLWGYDPINDPVNIVPPTSNVSIGYDQTGYSFDLTDYRQGNAYNGVNSLLSTNFFDPIAPTQAYFIYNSTTSPYNRQAQSYFYQSSTNSISITSNQTPVVAPNYLPNAPRQYKLLNWFDATYIGPTFDTPLSNVQPYLLKSNYTLSSTSNTPIGGYIYDSNGALSLYDGVCGFTFLPNSGIWNLQSLMFNTAEMNRSNNTNHLIQYIGIFNTVDIDNVDIANILLGKSIVTLTLSKRRYYLPNQADNPGFANEYFANSNEYVFDSTDVQYGSYFYFESSTSNSMTGYTEYAESFLNDPSYLYSAIAFDATSNIIPISRLCGSLVPYPLPTYSVPIVSDSYYGNTTPNGKQLIVPSPITGSLPLGVNYTQVGYQQSMLFTTSALHMRNINKQIYDAYSLKPWVFSGTISPNSISANIIYNSNGYVIMNDGNFTIYSYDATQNHTLTYMGIITDDEIFSGDMVVGAFTTNTNSIIFMGLGESNGSNQIILKNYVLSNSSVQPFYSNYIPNNEQIEQFQCDDNLNIFFTTYCADSNSYFCYYSSNTALIRAQPSALNASLLNTIQPYFDIPMDSSSGILLSGTHILTFSNNNPSVNSNYLLPNTYTFTDIIQIKEYGTQMYYSLAQSNSTYMWAKISLSSNALVTPSTQIFTSKPKRLVSGAFSSKWVLFSSDPYLYANRFILDSTMETAWQIFYPSYKFIFTEIASAPIPMIDLTGVEPPEYFHTNIFVYNDFAKLSNDIQSWGKEANYLCCDTQFRGFQFNSYINNIPVESNITYYLAVRGYAPSEQFETMVRFYLPNRYDFRSLTIPDLIADISTVQVFDETNNGVAPPNFNPVYATSVINYDALFKGNYTFGGNIIPGFPGVSSNWQGFGDLYNSFVAYYNTFDALTKLVNGIQQETLSNVNTFIATELVNVLPSNALTRSRYTDPLLYSILFGTGNNYAFAGQLEEWGIGWNLGFPKVDTSYLTRHTGSSFFKILDDYIYASLNEEFNFNRLDTTGPENLQQTRETTGLVGKYNMKLLLNTFGNYTQTAIMNPIAMNPPLGKLDRISFTLLDMNGNVLNNMDCEWNASLNITETLDVTTAKSTIIRGKAPSS